jgi:site-specific DNA-methyltransferase (adenine-specific)
MSPLDSLGTRPAPTVARSRAKAEDTVRWRVGDAAKATWQGLAARKGTVIVEGKPVTAAVVQADALRWMRAIPSDSIHAIVTDPPYGLVEYEEKNHAKLRSGRGGIWRIPPSFDGAQRAPVPRFTVLTSDDRKRLEAFFGKVARRALRVLVPGGHLIIASNPLLSSATFAAFERAGFEKRGEIIRLTQTLRGGDRPKGAEEEFSGVSVMPRSGWEPWGLFRKPISEPTVAANLRRWGTGGLRRVSSIEPFRDVIRSGPTREAERKLSPHPSLKPQAFMRAVVRGMLPIGAGLVYDPFTGGGSTLAAAHHLDLPSIGTEMDAEYAALAAAAIPRLSAFEPPPSTINEHDAR